MLGIVGFRRDGPVHTSRSGVDPEWGFAEAWGSVATFLTMVAGFLAILLAGWFVARAVAAIVTCVLRLTGFDRLVRGLPYGHGATGLLTAASAGTVLLVALWLGLGVFGPTAVGALLGDVVAWLPRCAAAIVLAVVAAVVGQEVRLIVTSMVGAPPYGRILGRFAAVLVWGAGAVAALALIGVPASVTVPILVTVLVTVGATLAVAIGGGLIRPADSITPSRRAFR